MPILRKQKTSNFTTVNNYFINDSNLKPDGKGFLLFMLSKPDDWKFNFINFQKSLGIGEKAVRSLVNKLECLKYLKRERIRDEFGHYEWNYFVYEEPYDLVLKRENLPYAPLGYVESGDDVRGKIYQNTNITNTESNKDKIDKSSQGLIPDKFEHNILTKELINLNYIEEKDELSSIYFDNLFNNYLLNGKSYKELFSAIHYIVPRVVSRKFIDEDGDQIINKYGYFKNAIESNFSKLENLSKELYSDDDSFWKDFEL